MWGEWDILTFFWIFFFLISSYYGIPISGYANYLLPLFPLSSCFSIHFLFLHLTRRTIFPVAVLLSDLYGSSSITLIPVALLSFGFFYYIVYLSCPSPGHVIFIWILDRFDNICVKPVVLM
jgi:hypothetical protein